MSLIDTPQIAVPFDILPNGQVDEVEQDTLDEIAMAIEVILRYPLDYRVDLPEFGIPELTFRERPEEIAGLLQEHIARWEDRVNILIENRPDLGDELVQNFTVHVQANRSI